MSENLYVHFPFCRRKCTYCALHSRAGASETDRAAYVRRLADEIRERRKEGGLGVPDTIYFGGGSPGFCDLSPVLAALDETGCIPSGSPLFEFTVELHPLDVTDDLLHTLRDGGVNRISMGLQSVDDEVLAHMGRGYTFAEAERAFSLVRSHFENAGIDLIAGYPVVPGDDPDAPHATTLTPRHARLAKWGLAHCSAYSLIDEERSVLHGLAARGKVVLPDDDTTMDRLSLLAHFFADLGLERYEISNFARPGCECRHNLAVWRGEDYTGLGEGAFGRHGRDRTRDGRVVETLSAEADDKERTIFRLRTRDGLKTAGRPEWEKTLDAFVGKGLLTRTGSVYRLTDRGTEVCDAILCELV